MSREPLEKWKAQMANPLRKAWAKRYLRWIGAERLAIMGYDLEALLAEVDAIPLKLRSTASDARHVAAAKLHQPVRRLALRGRGEYLGTV